MEVVGQKFSHRPGNPATVGVVRWPAAGDTAGNSLCRLNSLQHRIYNLLGWMPAAKYDGAVPYCQVDLPMLSVFACATELLRSLFDVLYDEEVIAEETFRRWQGSSDPAEQAGKGVAVHSVQQFFTWLDGSPAS